MGGETKIMPDIPVKAILIFLALSLLVGAFQKYGSDREEQGFNKARTEMLEQFQKDLEDLNKKKAKELLAATESRDKWKDKAVELQNRPPKKVKVYVKDIVENNVCTNLNGFSVLFNALRDNYIQ